MDNKAWNPFKRVLESKVGSFIENSAFNKFYYGIEASHYQANTTPCSSLNMSDCPYYEPQDYSHYLQKTLVSSNIT